MAAISIKITPVVGGQSFRITNKTGALAVPTSAKIALTGSLSTVKKEISLSGPQMATLLTGIESYLDITYLSIYATIFPPDDFYKVTFTGYDAGGNVTISSNIDAVFSSMITEGIVSQKMLAPIDISDKTSLIRRLARALVVIDGLRILAEDLTIDKEISVLYRIKLLKRDFQ